MPRRDAVARLNRYFQGPRRTWTGVAAALWMAAASATLLLRHHPAPVRVAIRVDCHVAGACERAEAVALDVWSEERGADLPLDVVVTDDVLGTLEGWALIDADIDATAREEAARIATAPQTADWFAEYRDFEAIGARLHELAARAPDRASLQSIGGSVEGRPLWALRIGHGETRMLINGTQHAREWLATMAVTCVADRMVTDYDTDPKVRDFVDHTSLWVVPVANPDGYQYAWGTDRYWRKNRRGGYGVDTNRNFSVEWGGRGASANKRAENYRGEYAFSEPESSALRDLAKRETIGLHIDFHTYSQLVMYPWGYTAKPAPDRDRLAAVGDRITSAIYAQHQKAYKLMQSVELYPTTGTMTDWMYGEAKAQSYTIELRPGGWPGGRGGFVQPPAEIRPTCDEAMAAVLEMRKSNP